MNQNLAQVIPHSGQSMSLPYRLLWLGIYLTVMVGVVRPLGKWLVRRQNTIALSYEVMGITDTAKRRQRFG